MLPTHRGKWNKNSALGGTHQPGRNTCTQLLVCTSVGQADAPLKNCGRCACYLVPPVRDDTYLATRDVVFFEQRKPTMTRKLRVPEVKLALAPILTSPIRRGLKRDIN